MLEAGPTGPSADADRPHCYRLDRAVAGAAGGGGDRIDDAGTVGQPHDARGRDRARDVHGHGPPGAAARVAPPMDRVLDGVDVLGALSGKATTVSRPQPLFWRLHMAPNAKIAMRVDDWKILADAASGAVKCLILVGTDVVSDFPDTELVTKALNSGVSIIAVDSFLSPTAQKADVVLALDAFVPWVPGRNAPPASAWVAAVGNDPVAARTPTFEFTADLRAVADIETGRAEDVLDPDPGPHDRRDPLLLGAETRGQGRHDPEPRQLPLAAGG